MSIKENLICLAEYATAAGDIATLRGDDKRAQQHWDRATDLLMKANELD